MKLSIRKPRSHARSLVWPQEGKIILPTSYGKVYRVPTPNQEVADQHCRTQVQGWIVQGKSSKPRACTEQEWDGDAVYRSESQGSELRQGRVLREEAPWELALFSPSPSSTSTGLV